MSGANPRRFPRLPLAGTGLKKAIRTLEAAGWELLGGGRLRPGRGDGPCPPRLGPRLLRPAGKRSSPPSRGAASTGWGCATAPSASSWTARCWKLRPSAGKGAIPTSATPDGGHLHRQPAGRTSPAGISPSMRWPSTPSLGFYDPFGGLSDLKERRLRAVGSPVERMQEDPLRILRGLRFIARLGLAPDRETAAAFRSCCPMLGRISRGTGLRRTDRDALRGKRCWRRCWGSPEVLAAAIPELAPLIGFDQHTPYHLYDVWGHTARAVAAIPAKPLLRWVMLLHDIGKPGRFTLDKTGTGHFKGHAALSAAMAEEILLRLAMPGAERKKSGAADPLARRARSGRERAHLALLAADPCRRSSFFRLLAVKRADNLAQKPGSLRPDSRTGPAGSGGAGFPGREPAPQPQRPRRHRPRPHAAGLFPGPELGAALRRLTAGAARGDFPNEKAALLQAARRMKAPAAGLNRLFSPHPSFWKGAPMPRHLLLYGPPACGKSTAILRALGPARRLAGGLPDPAAVEGGCPGGVPADPGQLPRRDRRPLGGSGRRGFSHPRAGRGGKSGCTRACC